MIHFVELKKEKKNQVSRLEKKNVHIEMIYWGKLNEPLLHALMNGIITWLKGCKIIDTFISTSSWN